MIENRDKTAIHTAEDWNEKYLDYKKWCEFVGLDERARLSFVEFCNARADQRAEQ